MRLRHWALIFVLLFGSSISAAAGESVPSPCPVTPPRMMAALPPQYSVPNFTGKTLDEVNRSIGIPGTGQKPFTAVRPQNTGVTVASQNPPAGARVPLGACQLWLTFAAVFVPKSPVFGGTFRPPTSTVTVPDLTRETRAVAQRVLDSLKLTASFNGDPNGTVQRQVPLPGTQVAEQTTVTLILAGTAVVPPVKGLTVAAAEQALAGSRLGTGRVSPYQGPADRIIDQSPAAGLSVPSGSPVNLVTAQAFPSGPVVPSVVGDTRAAASQTLSASNLRPAFTGDTDGTVVRQLPVAGSQVPAGSVVTLTLYQRTPQVVVPRVTGLALAQATGTLTAASLQTGSVSPTKGQGDIVVAQDPAAGTSATAGTGVNLTTQQPAQKLPVVVPLVVGDTGAAAGDVLQGLGLTAHFMPDGNGTVLRQIPDAGSRVQPGTAVNLFMGAQRIVVPSVIGRSLRDAEARLVAGSLQTGSVGPSQSPADKVIGQAPSAGASVSPGSIVNLTTASAQVVPQDNTPQASTSTQTQTNIQTNTPTNTPASTTPNTSGQSAIGGQPGTPSDQSANTPNAGPDGDLPPASLVQVPDVTTGRLTKQAAEQAMQSRQLVAQFDGPPLGVAVSQTPFGNLMVAPGTQVQVELEMPQVAVPNLRREDLTTALEALDTEHLKGHIQPVGWSLLGPVVVQSQEPMPGAMTDEGSTVQVVMGHAISGVRVLGFCCLAGLIGFTSTPAGRNLLRKIFPHAPAVCTVVPQTGLTPRNNADLKTPAVRFTLSVRDRAETPHHTIDDDPAVTEVRRT